MREKQSGYWGRNCTKEVEHTAINLGKKLAKVADILISGGLSGVMKAVSKGFNQVGGLTIGILPGYDKLLLIPM